MTGLFDSIQLRGITLKNRIAVSPMSQYRAKNGYANDWHLVHLGRFALGGAGLVFAEATAVEADGRRTHGDLGLWEDQQIEQLQPVTKFIAAEGSVAGIQLGHAGRKASERRPWHGETPVDEQDILERNEAPWTAIAPSKIPYADGWPSPIEMSEAQIEKTLQAFKSAARRSAEAGFRVIEIYAAHGFLVHQFLSPITNKRTDKWGGDAQRRCRFAIEVARAVRSDWPEEYPLIFRLSATDWLEGGLEIEDVVEIARALAAEGVDMIDCSTGGIGGRERPKRMKIEQGFQVPFADRIREEAGIATMAVGFLWDAKACQAVIDTGSADMIAMAREFLDDPNWPLHAAAELGADERYSKWHSEFGWWLDKRERLVRKLGLR
ncbi:NADH:flavin oxidoreductase/NADH oxidase [Sneathiella marina]|uniref:NADH:flavin oxidoreductase/NADH oxidase n=1 Tax=Sneathiella marina TaxID=2950108 RepID=A0ABY4W5R4_9PROT|nr:NADH:flavin oxidoreductase/NADH oxidase [Sneathiella marina]USG62540.1 NADH:flavin oxidoreductase/NADH oxidase [Sneathiella marina]